MRVYGRKPHDAVALGLVSAVMQTGGLLKDYTVEETVRLTAVLFGRPPSAVDRGPRAGRHRRHRQAAGRQVLRRAAAAAAVRDGAAARPGAADPGRADHRHGRRRPARLLDRRSARTRSGGRTVIFATHYLEEADAYADRVVFVRRGRIVADGTAAEVKALASGRTVRATLPGADRRPTCWRSPGWRPPRSAATPSTCTAGTPTRSPGTCSTTPPPGTWRSPPGTWRRRS